VLFPKISIITVTVQPLCDLEKTADSILAQVGTGINFEWILVVGRHFEEYQDFFLSSRQRDYVKLFYQEPTGIYSAMNLGMSKVLGDWIWFINCGDFLKDQNVLEMLGTIMIGNPKVDFIASPVLYTTPQGDWFDVSWPKILDVPSGREAHVHHQGVLLQRIICEKIEGGFDTRLRFAADGKFLDIAAGQSNVLIIDSILAVFVMGGASSKNYISTVREAATYRKSERS
jgi:glycosyltransferase involved in cell wall biosynthesis